MTTQPVLLLKRSEVRSLLTLPDCIPVVEEAFRLHAEGQSLAAGLLNAGSGDGEFHIKAGGLRFERTYFALKANGSFFHNRERHGLPNIQGVIILFDGDNGSPLAILDSIEITLQRTGAAVAVAARHLAQPDSSVVTVCGCGQQGRVQLRALRLVLPALRHAYAFDADPAAARRYASEMAGELDL